MAIGIDIRAIYVILNANIPPENVVAVIDTNVTVAPPDVPRSARFQDKELNAPFFGIAD